MNDSQDTAARITLKLAGTFQEVKDMWSRRLDSYFAQLESLVDGQWLDASDVQGIIRESKSAAREALDGLGSELSAELVHASNGLVARFQSERFSMEEEIADLRLRLSRILSSDENSIRRENEDLRIAIATVPEFQILEVIRHKTPTTYKDLTKATNLSKSKIRKYVKELVGRGYVHIDKSSKPYRILLVSTPWATFSAIIKDDSELTHARLPSGAPFSHP
jgi:DNA-binding MarR family transcriptional regulator